MRKFLKILGIALLLLTLLIVILQFVGFNIGSVHFGKTTNNLKSENVETLNNSAFANEVLNSDKLTCINIWATWCVPCIAEIPELNSIKSEFANRNVQFISLSIDSDSTKLRKFIDSKKFHFEDITFKNIKEKNAILNFLEGQPINQPNSSQIVPLTYIIKNGKVIEKIQGGTDAVELRKLILENL